MHTRGVEPALELGHESGDVERDGVGVGQEVAILQHVLMLEQTDCVEVGKIERR